MEIRDPSPGLYNEDLAPARERNWGAFSIFNVWTSDVHSLWGYYLAASLFLLCGSFVNFVLAIGIGSLVIFALMNLIGYAGEKTGVPYPVLARASFGVWGANLAALVRAIVACFWYGAQTAAASGAMVALLIRSDSLMAFHNGTHFLGHSGLEVICYVVIWALQLLIIQNGMETVRKFQDWAGPAVWVAMLILAIGLCVKAGGFSFEQRHSDGRAAREDQGRRRQRRARLVLGADGSGRDLDHLLRGALPELLRLLALRARTSDAVKKGNLWGLPVNLIAVLAGRRRHHHRRLQGLRRSAAAPRADLGQVRQLGAGAHRGADLRGRHAGHQRGRQFRLARVRHLQRLPQADRASRRAAISPRPSRWCSIRSRRGKATPRTSSTPSARRWARCWAIILVDYYLVAKGNINVAALYQEHGEYRYEGGWNVNALIAAGDRQRVLDLPAELHQPAAGLVGYLWLVLRRADRRRHVSDHGNAAAARCDRTDTCLMIRRRPCLRAVGEVDFIERDIRREGLPWN